MNKQELLGELRREGFSEKILSAFETARREDFVSEDMKSFAYENQPLSIGKGQTISQPYTIAFMLDLLELDKINKKNNNEKSKILEVGSGSGYVLALINELCENCQVFGIERVKDLFEKSKAVLRNRKNIKLIHGDGSFGIEGKKFDRILVSAAANKIPKKLIESLDDRGILVIPVRNSIFKIRKEKNKIKKTQYPGFVFVPLVTGQENFAKSAKFSGESFENSLNNIEKVNYSKFSQE